MELFMKTSIKHEYFLLETYSLHVRVSFSNACLKKVFKKLKIQEARGTLAPFCGHLSLSQMQEMALCHYFNIHSYCVHIHIQFNIHSIQVNLFSKQI